MENKNLLAVKGEGEKDMVCVFHGILVNGQKWGNVL